MSLLILEAWCYKGIIVTLLWWCISLSASVRLYVTPDLGSMMLQRDYSNTAVVVHQSVCMSRLILEAWCYKGIIVTLLWWCISLSASVRLYVTPDLGSMMLQRDYSNTAVVVHQSVCMSRLIFGAWCYKGIIVTLLWWCISLSASVRLYVTPDLGSMIKIGASGSNLSWEDKSYWFSRSKVNFILHVACDERMNPVYCQVHNRHTGIPYIGNFSRRFKFCWVHDLPEIAKNRHSEKLTLLYIFIESPWNSENRTQWKFNTPS